MGDLGCGVGEQVGVRVGRCAGLVARVGEQVRRPPQQLDARALLVLGGGIDHFVEQRRRLLERGALGGDVAIVEAVERHPELDEELERRVHLLLGSFDRIGGRGERRVPGAVEGTGPEDVEAVPVERVPVAHGKAQMVFHPPAGDDPVGVVPVKRQRIVAVGALVGNGVADVVEELGHCVHPRRSITRRSRCRRSVWWVDRPVRPAP